MTTWFTPGPASDLRRGVLLGILGGGVPPGSPNPDPIMTFSTPFSDQISKIHTHFQIWPNLACSRLSDIGETSQFPPVLFSCSRFLNSADPTISELETGYA